MRRPDLIKAGVLALVLAGISLLAVAMTPRNFRADHYVREPFSKALPQSFGDWSIDNTIVPIPPSPDLQAVLDETYDETVATTYRNPAGDRVMLSLAYGRNQHKGMNTHRPEVCYPAQGFKVTTPTFQSTVKAGDVSVPANRLVATMGGRVEPITYWLLVGDEITQFGYPQRRVAIRYGLKGVVPDGILFRVSSIDRDSPHAFAMQDKFIRELFGSLSADTKRRLVGTVND